MRREPNSIERIFKLATAFTHPRRIEVFRALTRGGGTADQLKAATRISRQAFARHLAKLKARGFVVDRAGSYVAATPRDGLGRALARLAAG